MSDFNPFVNDFNKLREFLKIIYLFGCYSRDDAENLKISKRKFDDELRRIRSFLKEGEYLSFQKEGKKVLPCIIQDFFKEAENPLINIYFSKTATALETTLFFLILQVINLSESKRVSKNQILDKINIALYKRTENSEIETSIMRMINKLEKLNIIKYLNDEKVYTLSNVMENIFNQFSDDELKWLYIAVLFFVNASVPNICGWYFKESFKKYLETKKELSDFVTSSKQVYWFTYVTHHNVLDEALVFDFWMAVSEGKKIKILYRPRNSDSYKEYTCIPLRIIYDAKLGRWYFIVLNKKAINTFPVSRIRFVEKIDESFDKSLLKRYTSVIQRCFFVSIPLKKQGFKKVRIKFFIDEDTSFNFVLNRIKRELKDAKIEIKNKKEFTVEYQLSNIKEFKPWLRSFGARAVVLDDEESKRLRDEMIEDWKEILKSYGDIR